MKINLSTASKLLIAIIVLQNSLYSYAAKWSDNGVYDISWYNKTQKDFYISSASQLAGMAYLVNNNFTSFLGATIHLSKNIDLYGKEWDPIGSDNTTFLGFFDGHGFTISNVSITNTDRYYCGFWKKIRNSKVSNLNLKTMINIDKSYIGAIAGMADNTLFENINVECNISYMRTKISYGSTSTTYENCIGGIVGRSNDCEYHNVKSNNNISFLFGASNGGSCYGRVDLYLGGVVGYGELNVYEKCQTINNFDVTIYGYEASNYYSSSGASTIICGGIVGYDYDSKTKIISCLAKTNNFSGCHYKGNYDTKSFTYGGIVGKNYGTLQNCVAITSNYSITGHSYSWVASWYHTNSTYGGVAGSTPKTYGGCYSNNDVVKTTKMVESDSWAENGSTSFSSTQMNTQSFVDELNLYSQLMFDSPTWGLDNDGYLMLIDDTTVDAIETIYQDSKSEIKSGKYIIDGKLVIIDNKGRRYNVDGALTK